MNRSFSVYLDIVRFGAACLVYLSHSNNRLLVTDILPFSNLGHISVIVFFVLSGFVIAYVADSKETEWIDFTASRLSRIYSVALPALVLTIILDGVGRCLHPTLYDYPYDLIVVRFLASLFMLNEVWFTSITYLSNGPFWSITYEIWYYVIFALITFLPWRWALISISAIFIALGPKILLLLPIWASGVVLFRWQRLRDISISFGMALTVISVTGIAAFHKLGVFTNLDEWTAALVGPVWFRELTFSHSAVGDWLLCLLVCMNFSGMRCIAQHMAPFFEIVERPVRALASYTLTLYLMHQPLLLFWGAVLRGNPDGWSNWLFVTAATATSVGLIGHFTENKRYLVKVWLHKSILHAAQSISHISSGKLKT